MKSVIHHYPVRVEWTEEDDAFLGSCPDLFWGEVCRAETENEVLTKLEEIIRLEIEEAGEKGVALPAPSQRPSRLWAATPARQRTRLNQQQFAAKLGVGVGTVRNWEQGRTKPKGAAATLLKIIEKHPEILDELD